MEPLARWMRQATEARDQLRADGMTVDMFLEDAFQLNTEAAAKLVEALFKLGAPISPRLIDLAGLDLAGTEQPA